MLSYGVLCRYFKTLSNGEVGPGAATWLPALDRLISFNFIFTLHPILREPQTSYSIVSIYPPSYKHPY